MMTDPIYLARQAAEKAQEVPVRITVPYELRRELADWIIAEVKKLEAGALALPIRSRAAADRRSRRDRLNARADLWRSLYDRVVP